ncbi:unnamed protein product [Ectocarpus sp. 4 AP-2014]
MPAPSSQSMAPVLPGAPTAQPIVALPTTRPANAPVDLVDQTLTPVWPIAPVMTVAPMLTPVPEATPVPTAQAPSVSGSIIMTENALTQCEIGCAEGLAAAFDLLPHRVRCACPRVRRRSLRSLLMDRRNVTSFHRSETTILPRRRLAPAEVPYVVTVTGITIQRIAQSINHFQANYMEVSKSLRVPEYDVDFSPLVFTAASPSPINLEGSLLDVPPPVVNPPAAGASASAVGMFIVFVLALLLGTICCMWSFCGKYCSSYPIRKGGMLAPHQKAVAPASAAFLTKMHQKMRARESIAASFEFGSVRSASGAPGLVSAEDDIDYTPIRRGASPRRIS